MKKTDEQFRAEIVDRDFVALKEYMGNKVKLLFRCDICGHEWAAVPNNILTGSGCPGCQSVNKILEHYEDDTVLIDISTAKYPLAVSHMDLSEFVKIKGRICLNSYGYPVTKIDGKLKRVHQLVMPECPEGKEIDHIDRNRRNNCISNLRYVSHRQNMQNRSDNTSGVPGVCWHKTNKKWIAQIEIEGKNEYLGSFDTLEEATTAREAAEALMEVI